MTRIEQEKRTVSQMIGIYCRNKHRRTYRNSKSDSNLGPGPNSDIDSDVYPEVGPISDSERDSGISYALCPNCQKLLNYAIARLSNCPFGNNKTTCRKCTVHCYRTDMRENIIAVMKYSGPRMLLHNPVAAIRHLLSEIR